MAQRVRHAAFEATRARTVQAKTNTALTSDHVNQTISIRASWAYYFIGRATYLCQDDATLHKP